MAWNTQRSSSSVIFRIYVVRSIDDTIQFTYTTGVRDFVAVPVAEAKRALEKGNCYYIATDEPSIAKEYNLRLIEKKYK